MHFPSLPRLGRKGALVVLAIVIVVLASGSGAGVLAYTNVKDQATQLQAELTAHLQIGQTELEAGKTTLKDANTKHDLALIAQANVHFTTAKVQFMVARQIADNSRLLQRLEGVPEVGGMARSRRVAVDAIADIGVAVSDAGRELADLDAQLIKPPAAGGHEARTLLTVLAQTSQSLVRVREDLLRAQKAGATVDISVIPTGQRAGFVKARSTINSALDGVVEFQRLVPVLTEMLGGNGTRTYLVEQVNAAELRPGGGFIGTWSLLQADQGTLKLIRSGTGPDISYPRPLPGRPGYEAPPGPFREWIPNASWTFQDSNFFPDFPSNAQNAERFAQPKLGMKIDAVISIDFYAVARMLDLTGPLVVRGYPKPLDANNFVAVLIENDLSTNYALHRELQNAIAGPLMDRIASLPPEKWPALVSALNDLAVGRHLQAYFNNDTLQKEVDLVGWSGTVNPAGSRDYMMEVESNLGGTKANYFITRNYTVELTRNGSMLHHKVIVDLMNDMPYDYRPDEFYSAYVRLYVSGNASQPANNLRRPWYASIAPPPGIRMSEGWVTPTLHGYHHANQFAFEYDTPWQANSRGEAQIYWQKQPGTVGDAVSLIWHDGAGHTYTTKGDLGQDRVITVSSKGVTLTAGQPAKATLPSLSL